MKRRHFLGGLGGAVTAWPLATRAQHQAMPVVGFLNAGSAYQLANFAAAYVRGLSESGYAEGKDVRIEYRWANGTTARLPELAASLVSHRVALIAAFGTPSARVAKSAIAGTSIPMVFANGSDPVADGLVASINRPAGNITGVTSIAAAIVPKRLELLRELVPNISTVAILINPNNPLSVAERTGTEIAASSVGQRLEVLSARNSDEVELAFAQLRERKVGGLIITTDLFYFGHMKRFAELAIQHGMPAVAPLREFAVSGGLISYGASIPDAYRQAGVYSGRVLKGEKPEDLPILQPIKFDYVINLATAKALGLDIPPMMLARADEVIE